MNFAIIYPVPSWRKNGQILVRESFGRRVTGLSECFSTIILFLPVSENIISGCTYKINQENIEIVQISPHSANFVDSFFVLPSLAKAFLRIIKNVDIVYIGFPTMVAFPMWIISKTFRKPTILHLVSNVLDLANIQKKRGRARYYLFSIAASLLFWLSKLMAKHSLVVTNGVDLYNSYLEITPNVLTITTGSIFDHEIIKHSHNLELNRPIKLLFVGSLIERKGIKYLIQGLDILINKYDINVTLTIVGDGTLRRQLEFDIKNRKLIEHVKFAGFVSPADGLFDYYLNSDILVLPSLSEGTPRVLIEAMAHGIPIVATSISGIRETVIDHENGILIPPENGDAIALAVLELIKNKELRFKISENSVSCAKNNTLEKQSNRISSAVYNFVKGKGNERKCQDLKPTKL